MTDDRLSELLSRDIGTIPVPDMWDRVQQKVSASPQTAAENHHTYRKRTSPLIYALIGGSAVSVTLLLLIGVAGLPQPDLLTGQPAGSSPSAGAAGSDHLPMVSAETGSLALSGRSTEELEALIGRLAEGESVYEDSAYLYRFDSDGCLTYMLDEESHRSIDIEETARRLLQRHFPDISIENYSIYLGEDTEHPSLCAKAEMVGEGLTITEIKITFYTDEWQKLLGLAEE